MNTYEFITSYALPVAASIAVLWLAYRLLFVNSNRFKFNRDFLLVALLFSLALPLVGMLMGLSVPQIVNFKHSMFPGYTLNEIVITPEGQEVTPITLETIIIDPSRHISLWQVLGIIYLLGVAVMATLFLVKLVRLVALIIRSPKRKMNGYTAVFTHKEQGSFSFFRYAFFPDENVSPDIVRHEMSHIAHGHSWDILFVEIIMILQWFNPFIYFYRRELQSLHEYSADHDVVISGVDKKNYMMLILQQCTAVDFSSMSNNFSLLLTKKRIKMITRNEKARSLWWRLLVTIPVLAVLLIANAKVAAQEKTAVDKPMTVEMGEFEIRNDDGTPLQFKDTVIYNPDGSYIQCETSDGFDPISGEPRKKMTITAHSADGTVNDNMILHCEVDGDVARYTAEPFKITALEPAIVLLEGLSTDKPDNDTVFSVCEEMPEFPGGSEKFMEYLSGNITYPEDAKEKGISGRVFIQFVIEKDGSVSNVKVMKGIGGGCDEEAVRVVKAMPKWKPGKQKGKPVRVNYILPVSFKLDEGETYKSVKGETKADEKIYEAPETMPEYPGGMDGLRTYLQENLTVPEKYQNMKSKAEYRVLVKFVVAEDGSITKVETMKPEPAKKDLNDEAVRAIKGMPKWKPGTVGGKPVKVKYVIPVVFRLGK